MAKLPSFYARTRLLTLSEQKEAIKSRLDHYYSQLAQCNTPEGAKLLTPCISRLNSELKELEKRLKYDKFSV